MTRALRSHAFVKGLLKAWNIEAECMPKSAKYSDATMLDDQSLVVGNASCNLQLKDLNRGRAAAWKIDAQNQLETVGDSACPLGKLNVYNSVTAGVLDSTVKQWIHMVCGLWTPETRCPNVDTMSAFDVSGVSSARENVKEYARYKQAKGWKHLVVYKSGIHALGLYTSRFISRGEMVVEYVGEIVGLRVADKREKEYESGRKVQYKSACYFFRIDKEHIIDATRKGGIARFVNHSCLVVFFAERDIYPGEEITYDYHFNHEDEGKKIPCFCNSKNCRRYLN
ncbi:hypothetical protein COLO4_18906 [Corchorus olitorius]|uniref:SET domain-containing protein n=1 Tax=Corchorus olitorius TaxID=93759 RepID=A0A1R3J7F4_9ROSI|nr:hypothetical protein COLO4_18906 [Corchorus olitorius]